MEAHETSHTRRLLDDARQGVVGGAAFWLVALLVALGAGILGGDVPAWALVAVALPTLVLSGLVITGVQRKLATVTGERDEARRMLAESEATREELIAAAEGSTMVAAPAEPEATRAIVARTKAMHTHLTSIELRSMLSGPECSQLEAIVDDLAALFGEDNPTISAARDAFAAESGLYIDSALMLCGQLEALATNYIEPVGPMGSMS